MEKGKTAIQIAIEKTKNKIEVLSLDRRRQYLDKNYIQSNMIRQQIHVLEIQENMLKELLETEKKQIIISYTQGMNEILRDRKSKFNGSDYFEQKFGE